jgi:hypothetical protein
VRRVAVRADCGCYTASLSAFEVPPGGAATLTVVFRTLTFSGSVRKKVVLAYDDGAPRTLEVPLHLEILAGVLTHTSRVHFGEVAEGVRPEGMLRVGWYEGVGEPFQLLSAEVPGHPVDVHWTPWRGTKDTRLRGYELRLAFQEPPPKGLFQAEIVVRTSSPARPRLVVPLTGHVVGTIYVPRPRVYFGIVRRGTARSADVPFRARDAKADLGEVRVRAREGRIRVTLLPADPGRPAERRLLVEVPEDAPVGPLDDVIEIRTDAGGDEVTTVDVRGRVF